MMLMWWRCRWSSSVAHRAGIRQSVKPPPPPADNAASPRLADTAERDYFTPQREADHYAKTTEAGTQKYINEIVDRVAHIDGQLMQLLWVIYTSSGKGV